MKATISGAKRISEGGCNACTSFALNVYHITFEDGTKISLERLSVPVLVMTFAQREHWQPSFTMVDMGEEAMVYNKDGVTIMEQETTRNVTYQKGATKVTVAQEYCDLEDLYQNTNKVLTEIFGMVMVAFDYVTIERDPVIVNGKEYK